MFTTHRYSNTGPVHFTLDDGKGNTWPICGTRPRWGLPEASTADVTCKRCQKAASK